MLQSSGVAWRILLTACAQGLTDRFGLGTDGCDCCGAAASPPLPAPAPALVTNASTGAVGDGAASIAELIPPGGANDSGGHSVTSEPLQPLELCAGGVEPGGDGAWLPLLLGLMTMIYAFFGLVGRCNSTPGN
jgi:hypothetical protein